MINKKLIPALNEQINKEFYSSYLYLAMSAYFGELNLTGFAEWMRIQAKEELEHGMKIFDYLAECGEKIEFKAIDKVALTWKSPIDAVKAALAHEQKVTKSIHNLVELAIKEKDYATNSFLQWFVNEQVEEEANAMEILGQLQLTKDCSCALLLLDKKLGKRNGE
jgi:ferritin